MLRTICGDGQFDVAQDAVHVFGVLDLEALLVLFDWIPAGADFLGFGYLARGRCGVAEGCMAGGQSRVTLRRSLGH